MRNAIASLTFAAALLSGASTLAEPAMAPQANTLPPIAISLYAAPNIPASTIQWMLKEADEIWKTAGFRFIWQRGAVEVTPYARSGDGRRYLPSMLRVTVDHSVGDKNTDTTTALGWIVFERPGEPDRELHVSYANATRLLELSSPIIGGISRMPIMERETYLARAMGRALAHELGHYLLASKVHTKRGLMQAQRSASDLFAPTRSRFEIDATQKQAVVARLTQTTMVSDARPDFTTGR
jgi:hypothetical protein